MEILQYSPGQTVTLVLEALNSDGYRADGYYTSIMPDGYGFDGYYTLPVVDRILLPSLVPAAGYPQKMVYIDYGIYYFKFTLPTGSTAVGSYIVDVKYVSPITSQWVSVIYQIVCTSPYGQYSVGTF